MCGQVEVVVLGGLTVDVDFMTYWEPGDCGYRGTYVGEWQIVGVNGKRKKNTDWVLNRLSAADEAIIIEACERA